MSNTLRQFRRSEGFTLIELLIVVAIIGIIAAIAIPSLLRSRMSANESATVGNLRAIVGANTDYNNNTTPHAYAESLGHLANGTGAGGIPFLEGWGLSDGDNTVKRSGYTLTYSAGASPWEYYVAAQPVTPGSSGARHFMINQAGVVCASTNDDCSASASGVAPCGDGATCQPIQ